jgi:ABC-2 type transport system permease protein
MPGNIFLHELKSRLGSVLTWSVSIFILILVFMSMFQGFAEDTAMVNQLMASFPRELLVAFGMADMDWSTLLGFFGLVFVFCQICLAIQAANYGFSLVSIEETEWTADFLLSKPVGRTRIMTAKLLASAAALALTAVVTCYSSLMIVILFSGGRAIDLKNMILLLVSIPFFQFFFLSVGMLISLLVKRVRSVTPFSMGLVFGLYTLNAFGDMIGEEGLEILSPFQHFTPSIIIRDGSWDLPLVMISLGVTILAIIVSYRLYDRRDIAAAV